MSIRAFPDVPFVGHLGTKNEILVVEAEGNLVCKTLRDVVVFTQVIALLFGGALTAWVWFSLSNPGSAHMPLFWTGLVALLALACWLAFFRNLLGTPHFEASVGTGDISLFRRRTREPWKTIRPAEISHFCIEKQFYTHEQLQEENAVLVLLTTNGGRVILCGSPYRAVIQSLAVRLGQLTQRKVEEIDTTKGLSV